MKWMRTEALLSLITIAMAFLSGVLVLSVRNGPSLGLTVPVLQQEIRKFATTNKPIESFRTDSLTEFINPQNLYPFYFKFDYQEIQDLQAFAQHCKPSSKFKKSLSLSKVWQWEEASCGHHFLPDSFFSAPPFFHPSGHSFAYLAKKDLAWKEKHLDWFHVFEFRELGISQLPSPYSYLALLDFDALTALSAGEPLIIFDGFVLLGTGSDGGYAVYDKLKWDGFWSETPFRPQSHTGDEDCFVKESSVCWSYDLKKAYFPKWNPLILLLVLSVLLTLIVFGLLAVRIQRRQKDQVRLKFTLEMLAHEIRTPAANLALTVETFRSEFDHFPEKTKSGLLRLFDQVERLKRVAETSRNYLQKNIGNNLIETNFTEVKSLSDFIHHTLDPYLARIDLQIQDDNSPVFIDPYWTSICIKNLIENALMHGAPPVKVTVRHRGVSWSIEILDKGTKFFDPLEKGEKSTGFGLGFKLVQNIVPYLMASLTVSYNPTRMTLIFREQG